MQNDTIVRLCVGTVPLASVRGTTHLLGMKSRLIASGKMIGEIASAQELYIKLAPVILSLMPIINRNLRLGGIYHTLVVLQIERKMSSLLPNKT